MYFRNCRFDFDTNRTGRMEEYLNTVREGQRF